VSDSAWIAACPACRTVLGRLAGAALPCETCEVGYRNETGVWRLVATDRQPVVDRFLADYTMIRRAEGRGSLGPAYFMNLPDATPDDPLGWQWTMRATTWRHVVGRVLPSLGSNLRVLDLGAGVGWLSNRLHELGHEPMAVDLSVDDLDGLGAAHHYSPSWPRVQAEFDRLPLADGQADLVIYNASFHYSVDYSVTLAEARRVLRPGGAVLVLDSPVYRRPESGPRMMAERHAQFEARFGTRSDSVPSIEFLTETMIDELGRQLGMRWQRSVAWYGRRWWWRPWKARLTGAREPSRFVTLLGRWPE
jgi:SAM-dependent methyltransferase